jgi:hypothetical protein
MVQSRSLGILGTSLTTCLTPHWSPAVLGSLSVYRPTEDRARDCHVPCLIGEKVEMRLSLLINYISQQKVTKRGWRSRRKSREK